MLLRPEYMTNLGRDEAALFKDPPPKDCPLCMLPFPRADHVAFKSCCGIQICNGCVYDGGMAEMKNGKTFKEIGDCPIYKTIMHVE